MQRIAATFRLPAMLTAALLYCSGTVSHGAEIDPFITSGWGEWHSVEDWQAYTVRGQDVAPQPEQPEIGPSNRTAGYDLAFTSTPELPAVDTAVPEGPLDNTPGVDQATPSDFTAQQSPEIGDVVSRSNRAQTTSFRQVSPLSKQPYIRGYTEGGIYTVSDGLYMAPIRPDLDSMLNRIDPSLFEDVAIIAGPYGLRYGPGFSFVRVRTTPTPRNPNGYDSSYRTGFSTRTNGGQVYGRQTVFGGGCDWGYIFQYGNRVGGDYRPGGNYLHSAVPGSYQSQSLSGQLGFDLSPDSRIEFRYRRLDDTNSDYALQFFDVDYMGADAYSVHYGYDDPCDGSRLAAMAWYSNSRFHGDTAPRLDGSAYYTITRVEAALTDRLGQIYPGQVPSIDLSGATRGHHGIMGARLSKTYGDPDIRQLSIGTDVRYNDQRLVENFWYTRDPNDPYVSNVPPDFYTNMPSSDMVDVGIFSELTNQWTPYLSTTLGGRIDWVATKTRASEFRGRGNQIGFGRSNLDFYGDDLTQNDVLLACYLANDLEISDNLNLRLAGGYAERAPTLLERYADGIFLGIAQSGFSRVIGTPPLHKEETWQVDLAVTYQDECTRARAAAFYGWTDDPITFIGFPAIDPTGARLLRYTNGNLYTRTGFELLGERNLYPRITAFGTLRYLKGRDRNIYIGGVNAGDRPMTGIYPLESRVGLRLHDNRGGGTWGCEVAVRMVDSQNDVGILRLGTTSVLGLDSNFEQRTGGFTTVDVRTYYNVSRDLYLVAGIDNLFDRTYLEHLNLRLPADNIGGQQFSSVAVISPGITPYVGMEWNY